MALGATAQASCRLRARSSGKPAAIWINGRPVIGTREHLTRIGVISVRPSGCSSGLGWQRGGEKLGEQLVDSVSLVVMDPMGGVGQPLDAVEVGYIVVLGLG